MVEDTAANVRPIIRKTSRLPQSYSIAVGAKRKKCTSTAGRVSRSATAFISAFRAKFGVGVIWLSEVRVGRNHAPSSLDRRTRVHPCLLSVHGEICRVSLPPGHDPPARSLSYER